MPDKITTIEGLAEFMYRNMAKKEDIESLREELGGEVQGLRAEMNQRFDKIENILATNHQPRIEKLEKDVKELKDMFAV